MPNQKMVTRSQAILKIASVRKLLLSDRPTESIAVDEIGGRILAESIVSKVDLPSQNHATMDGYAINSGDEYPLELIDSVFPEDSRGSISPGQAVRISTGATLPEGADAVLKREDANVDGGNLVG